MSVAACAALVARGDPDRFRAAMCAPLPVRGDLMVLYAFVLEVARAPWASAEPLIAQMRLQWWADAIDEIAAGGAPRRHEVATPLAALVRHAGIDCADLAALVAARHQDLSPEPPADMDTVWTYLDATAGTVSAIAVNICGGDIDAGAVGRRFGTGVGAGALLAALPELLARGRVPLPVTTDRNAAIEGRPDAALCDAIAALAARGSAAVAGARLDRPRVPRAARPALLPGTRSLRVLDTARADPAVLWRLPGHEGARDRLRFLGRYWFGRW